MFLMAVLLCALPGRAVTNPSGWYLAGNGIKIDNTDIGWGDGEKFQFELTETKADGTKVMDLSIPDGIGTNALFKIKSSGNWQDDLNKGINGYSLTRVGCTDLGGIDHNNKVTTEVKPAFVRLTLSSDGKTGTLTVSNTAPSQSSGDVEVEKTYYLMGGYNGWDQGTAVGFVKRAGTNIYDAYTHLHAKDNPNSIVDLKINDGDWGNGHEEFCPTPSQGSDVATKGANISLKKVFPYARVEWDKANNKIAFYDVYRWTVKVTTDGNEPQITDLPSDVTAVEPTKDGNTYTYNYQTETKLTNDTFTAKVTYGDATKDISVVREGTSSYTFAKTKWTLSVTTYGEGAPKVSELPTTVAAVNPTVANNVYTYAYSSYAFDGDLTVKVTFNGKEETVTITPNASGSVVFANTTKNGAWTLNVTTFDGGKPTIGSLSGGLASVEPTYAEATKTYSYSFTSDKFDGQLTGEATYDGEKKTFAIDNNGNVTVEFTAPNTWTLKVTTLDGGEPTISDLPTAIKTAAPTKAEKTYTYVYKSYTFADNLTGKVSYQGLSKDFSIAKGGETSVVFEMGDIKPHALYLVGKFYDDKWLPSRTDKPFKYNETADEWTITVPFDGNEAFFKLRHYTSADDQTGIIHDIVPETDFTEPAGKECYTETAPADKQVDGAKNAAKICKPTGDYIITAKQQLNGEYKITVAKLDPITYSYNMFVGTTPVALTQDGSNKNLYKASDVALNKGDKIYFQGTPSRGNDVKYYGKGTNATTDFTVNQFATLEEGVQAPYELPYRLVDKKGNVTFDLQNKQFKIEGTVDLSGINTTVFVTTAAPEGYSFDNASVEITYKDNSKEVIEKGGKTDGEAANIASARFFGATLPTELTGSNDNFYWPATVTEVAEGEGKELTFTLQSTTVHRVKFHFKDNTGFGQPEKVTVNTPSRVKLAANYMAPAAKAARRAAGDTSAKYDYVVATNKTYTDGKVEKPVLTVGSTLTITPNADAVKKGFTEFTTETTMPAAVGGVVTADFAVSPALTTYMYAVGGVNYWTIEVPMVYSSQNGIFYIDNVQSGKQYKFSLNDPRVAAKGAEWSTFNDGALGIGAADQTDFDITVGETNVKDIVRGYKGNVKAVYSDSEGPGTLEINTITNKMRLYPGYYRPVGEGDTGYPTNATIVQGADDYKLKITNIGLSDADANRVTGAAKDASGTVSYTYIKDLVGGATVTVVASGVAVDDTSAKTYTVTDRVAGVVTTDEFAEGNYDVYVQVTIKEGATDEEKATWSAYKFENTKYTFTVEGEKDVFNLPTDWDIAWNDKNFDGHTYLEYRTICDAVYNGKIKAVLTPQFAPVEEENKKDWVKKDATLNPGGDYYWYADTEGVTAADNGSIQFHIPCSGIYKLTLSLDGVETGKRLKTTKEVTINVKPAFRNGDLHNYKDANGVVRNYGAPLTFHWQYAIDANNTLAINTEKPVYVQYVGEGTMSLWVKHETGNTAVRHRATAGSDKDGNPLIINGEVGTPVEGYTLYGDAGIDFKGVAKTHFIFEKNGAYSDPISFVVSHDDTITGVDAVETEVETEVYTLDGVRVSSENLAPGIYVVRRGAECTKTVIR